MPSSLKASLLVTLRGILSFFLAPQPFYDETIPESELTCQLPPRREVDVKYYKDLLRIQIVNAQEPRAALERHRVVRLTQYQNHHFLALEREFLIAEVLLQDGGRRYIRIHRSYEHDSMVATPRKLPDKTDKDQDLMLKALNEDLKSWLYGRNSQQRAASYSKLPFPFSKLSGSPTSRTTSIEDDFLVDGVENSPFTISRDDICLLEMSQLDPSWTKVDMVEPQNLYLYQLATIAFVVQKRDFLFSPLTNQSFWYAAMIIGAIRRTDRDAYPSNVIPSRLATQSVEVYLSPKTISQNRKDASQNHITTTLASRSNDNDRGRKVVKMPIPHAYPLMVELLCSHIQAEMKSLSELIDSVEQREVALVQKIRDKTEYAVAEAARLKEQIDRVNEENLALMREIEKSDRTIEEMMKMRLLDKSPS